MHTCMLALQYVESPRKKGGIWFCDGSRPWRTARAKHWIARWGPWLGQCGWSDDACAESLQWVDCPGLFRSCVQCKGYSNSCETEEANLRYKKFTLEPQRSVVWWTGHIKGGMFTRRSPQFSQAAQMDEILVNAGNNQLPQDLGERSAHGFELHIHTVYHCDSRLDDGTVTANLQVTLLLRAMQTPRHSSSRDVIDRKNRTW